MKIYLLLSLIAISLCWSEWEIISPAGGILSSDDEVIKILWNASFHDCFDTILWMNNFSNTNGLLYNPGYDGYSNFADTLSDMGFVPIQISQDSIIDSELLSRCNIFIWGVCVTKILTSSEKNALLNFLNSGGRLFDVMIGFDWWEAHDSLLSIFGGYMSPPTYDIGCFDVPEGTHPVLNDVYQICTEGVPILHMGDCSRCIAYDTLGNCSIAEQEYGDGLFFVFYDEQFMWNGPTSAPYTNLYEANNLQFAKNIFEYLESYIPPGPDPATTSISIYSIDYPIFSPYIYFIEDTLIFSPPDDFWHSGETQAIISYSDSLGCEHIDTVTVTLITDTARATLETDPPIGVYDSCDIRIKVWLTGTSSKRVLWVNRFTWTPGRIDSSFSGDATAYTEWADSLYLLGFSIDEIDESTMLTSALLDSYDILVIGSVGEDFFPAESAAVWNFVNDGGAMLVIGG